MLVTLRRTDGDHLVDADWHAFCHAIHTGIQGSDWEDLYDRYKDMSKAAGVKKPNENQKAKALWKMKAAKDRGEDLRRSWRRCRVTRP